MAEAVFDPMPSWRRPPQVRAHGTAEGAAAFGVPVAAGGDVDVPGWTRQALTAAGFDDTIGQTLPVSGGDGPLRVAYGVGDPADLDPAGMRDAAAAFARAARRHGDLAIALPTGGALTVDVAAQAAVEGALLARYRYTQLRPPRPVEASASSSTRGSACPSSPPAHSPRWGRSSATPRRH